MTWNLETLDVLPGEGEEQVIRRVRYRHECHECGEPAHFKQTYLLNGSRLNSASSAFGRDDCSWCEDESVFHCKEHKAPQLEGYEKCSTFADVDTFAHMFLYWHEIKEQKAA